jgi:malonyl-CoA/methylmalonyl-CoA synthetase
MAPRLQKPAMALSPLLLRWRSLLNGLDGDAGKASYGRSPHVAIFDERGAHSYVEVNARAMRIAGALLASEPSRSDLAGARVALLVSPGASFVEAFFGVLLAGGAVVVLSTLHPHAETSYFVSDAKVDIIVVSSSLQDRVRGLAPRVLTVEAAREHPEANALPSPLADAPALQLYTSGTTGKPKGAVITHANLAVQQELLGAAWGWTANDVLLHTLPLHHMHGLAIALLTALGAGASARMLPQFDAHAVWEAMHASTVFMAVPTIYAKLLGAFDGEGEETRARWTANARALRLATSGSAALPVTLAERWRTIAGEYPLERFGMTEIGVGASNPLVGERRPGSVGRPLPTVETRVVDDELWIAGPSVFAGYFGKDDATTEAFVDLDGTRWFRTGDTVSVSEDGYVRILGRTSVDILKSGGYKLSALEIEEALREHAAIAEVAVVGLPDETWGDRVVACVVAKAGREDECTEDALRAFGKERLAPYKVPRTVVVMSELPRNAIGKVMKPELVLRLLARASP